MRRRLACLVALLGLFPLGAQAVLNTHDARPAATLLLPYFEVDPIPNFPESPSVELVGVPKTVLTVGNASQFSLLTRVTLWTDFGIPTLSFHLSLTGFDVETIDLKQTFDGILPQSAGGGMSCPDPLATRLPPTDIIGLRNAHSGQPSSLFGNLCGSRDFGDGALRGFVTVDVVTDCDDTLLPNDADYSTILGSSNALWGDWESFDPIEKFSDAGTMVHIEASPAVPDSYTFYGRFNAFNGTDDREALGNVWGIRFANGVLDGGTALRVWREPRAVPVPVACPVGAPPASQPGDAHGILAFDESEDVVSITTQPLPLVTQRVQVNGPALPVPFDFGWLLLNLNSGPGLTTNELKQSSVSAVSDALGRFSAGNDAFRMAHPVTAVNRNSDPDPGDNAPPYPAVAVTKQVSGTFQVGQNITYTVTVTRTGPGTRDCDLTDVLPAQLSLVSANASSGMVNADTMTNTVTWNGLLNDATPSATVTIIATINMNGFIANTAMTQFDVDGDGSSDGSVSATRSFGVP